MSSSNDSLAIDRTILANQRTLLAFVRTSFYFMGLGLTIIGIESFERLKFIALPLFIMSVIVIIVGLLSYFNQKKKIDIILNKTN